MLLGALAGVEAVALSAMDTATNTEIAHLDPAQVDIQGLLNEIDLEQNAVSTYLLSGERPVLFDYDEAPAVIDHETYVIAGLLSSYPTLLTDLYRVVADNATWRSDFADPSIRLHETNTTPSAAESHELLERTGQATTVQSEGSQLASAVGGVASGARATLNGARSRLSLVSFVVLGVLVLAAIAIVLGLRRWVARPVAELDASVRAVAEGDLRHELGTGGPPEIAGLTASVTTMRDRILDQLDLAEHNRAELAERAEALRLANADLERFADVASHDLQEPLRKVAGFSDLLIERYGDRLDDRGLEFVQYAADGARRMQALIDDLLSYSRVTKVNSRIRPLELGPIFETARRRAGPELESSGARLEIGPLPSVLGDPAMLTTLFEALLRNAVAYRSLRPLQIRVSAEVGGDTVRVSVADNGQGIQPEYADRVFGIFQRLNHDASGGTGLGLALARRILEVHGGRIWVDTGRQDGTTVHFELSAAPAEPEPAEGAEASVGAGAEDRAEGGDGLALGVAAGDPSLSPPPPA